MKPDLNNLKERIEGRRDFIDRIALGIPLFKGYLIKTENYDADSMIRAFLAEKLFAVKKNLSSLSSDMLKKGDFEIIKDLESLSNLIEGLVKKVQFAEYGTSGVFSKAKITEDDQNRLLEYDWRLISSMDELVDSAENLLSPGCESLPEGIKSFAGMIADFESSFNERKNVILEVI